MIRKLRVPNTAFTLLALTCSTFGVISAQTQDNGCGSLPDYAALKAALATAVSAESSGLNNQMWATLVDRDGIVCAVAFSGTNRGSQWPGSRAISAQKANTANAFSLDPASSSNGSGQASGLALSTANLYAAVQPGGSLYGLQASNPVDPAVAYASPSSRYGQFNDPMVGRKIGGVNVFGGGLALYGTNHQILGGLGVSGDTSCADHNIAWRVRNALALDHMAANANSGLGAVGGVSGDTARPDNIVFDLDDKTGVSKGGFGHPTCVNTSDASKNPLPAVAP
jgi:uncharacterized protein GlcG (DUF336 family)